MIGSLGPQRMAESSATISQAGEVRSARVESLRALAALAVLEGHIFGQSRDYAAEQTLGTYGHRILLGGGYGVFLFFGLTGYLLFWPFVRQHYGGGAPLDLRRYALNRVLRIVPLYLVAVIVLLIAEEHGGTFGQWWRFLTFSENFSTHTVGTVDGPMWSLAVEVEFYVLLPFLAWALAAGTGRSKWRSAGVLIALAAASYLARQHAIGGSHVRPLLEYSLPATFMFFVPGMLVALLRLHWEAHPPSWLRGVLGAGDAWLVAAAAAALWQFEDYRDYAPTVIATFLALGACVLPLSRGRIVRALDWRPLAVIGVASYSLYLWHQPILGRLASDTGFLSTYRGLLVVAAPLSIVVALVSYRLVEAPFLALRRQWASGRAASAPATTSSADPAY
jgi:peptidoglycan/LPS O-acetylase OafA/YrhL